MWKPLQTIHVDHARKLVDVRVSGLVTAENAGPMSEEVYAAIRSLGAGPGEHLTLYDVSKLSVAPAQTIELVKALFLRPDVRPLWAKKVAIVTGSALGRMQMQRVREVRDDITLFPDRDAAIEWLLA